MERRGTFLVRTRYGQALRVGGVRIPGIEVQGLDAGPVEFLFGIPIGSTVLRASLRCRHAIHEVGRTLNIRIGRYGECLHDTVFRLVVFGHLCTACHHPVVTGKSVGHFGGEVDGLSVHLAFHLDGFKLLRGRSGNRTGAVRLRPRLRAGRAHGEAQAVVALDRALTSVFHLVRTGGKHCQCDERKAHQFFSCCHIYFYTFLHVRMSCYNMVSQLMHFHSICFTN